ncbi:hypothetical protein Tco_0320439, partial [Tanacetum coccineum]
VDLFTKKRKNLFDEYNAFHAIGNESFHDYFVAFPQLVNDMKITPAQHSNSSDEHQVVNHLSPLIGGEGHVARQCKEPKRAKDSQYFKDKMLLMEAKEKGVTLDAEAEAFLADVECTSPYDQPLAMTTTNIFEVNHEDAYDSNVDEGLNVAAAFMANLSSIHDTNSQVNEEMHQEEHLDFDAENEIDDNTISYDQYLLDKEAQRVPTEISEICLDNKNLKNELLQCKQEICRLDTQKVKLDLENKVRQEQALVIQRNKRNAELEQENVLLKSALSVKDKSITLLQSEKGKDFILRRRTPQIELSREQAYWLPANEIASQASNPDRTCSFPYSYTSTSNCKQTASGKETQSGILDAQISIMKVLNVGSTKGSCDQQALDTDRIQLQDMITSLRNQSRIALSHYFQVIHMPGHMLAGEFLPPYYISQLGDSIIISGSFNFGNFRIIYAWELEVDDGEVSSYRQLFTVPYPAIAEVHLKQHLNDATVSNTDGNHKGYEEFQSPSHSLFMRNKPEWTVSVLMLMYQHLEVFENDVKALLASSFHLQNHEQTHHHIPLLAKSIKLSSNWIMRNLDQIDENDLEEMTKRASGNDLHENKEVLQEELVEKLQFMQKTLVLIKPKGMLQLPQNSNLQESVETKEDNRRRNIGISGKERRLRSDHRLYTQGLKKVEALYLPINKVNLMRLTIYILVQKDSTSESETQTTELDTCDSNISTEPSELVSEPVVNESNIEVQPKVLHMTGNKSYLLQTVSRTLMVAVAFGVVKVSISERENKNWSPKREEQAFWMNLGKTSKAKKEANEEAKLLRKNLNKKLNLVTQQEATKFSRSKYPEKVLQSGIALYGLHHAPDMVSKGKTKLGHWYPRESFIDLESYSKSDNAGAHLDTNPQQEVVNFLAGTHYMAIAKSQTIVALLLQKPNSCLRASCYVVRPTKRCVNVMFSQNKGMRNNGAMCADSQGRASQRNIGRKKAQGESSVQRDPLFNVMPEDKIDHMETENAQSEGRTREMVDEDKEFDEDRLNQKVQHEDFIAIGSVEDDTLINKLNKKDSSKGEEIKQESKEEVKEEDKGEENYNK